MEKHCSWLRKVYIGTLDLGQIITSLKFCISKIETIMALILPTLQVCDEKHKQMLGLEVGVIFIIEYPSLILNEEKLLIMILLQSGMWVVGNCVPALRRPNPQLDAAAHLPLHVLKRHR